MFVYQAFCRERSYITDRDRGSMGFGCLDACCLHKVDVLMTAVHVDLHLLIAQLRPVQTGNVWRPNTIKHCSVTYQADVEVSDQTVKTCLIKHRSNN